MPTRHFARVASYSGFYDARAVVDKLALVGCKKVRVLESDLVRGQDVPSVKLPKASCLSTVGVSGPILVVYAKGLGLVGIDVPRGRIAWRVPLELPGECERGTRQSYGLPPYEIFDATAASTCRPIVVAGDTVVSWESGGLNGRRTDTGAFAWHDDIEAPVKTSRLVADQKGDVFQPLPGPGLLRAFDAASGQRRWQRALQNMTLDDPHQISSQSIFGVDPDPTGDESIAGVWRALIEPTDDGVRVESPGQIIELGGKDGLERLCVRKEKAPAVPAGAPPVTFLGPTPLRMQDESRIAFDRLSLFVTEEYGQLVAYSLATGAKEWSSGILATDLAFSPTAMVTRPRVEWIGSEEVLVGFGLGSKAQPLLSLFLKGAVPLAPRTIRVEGRIRLLPRSFSEEKVCVGSTILPVDEAGRFSGDVSGNGSLRLSCPGSWTMASHLEPQTMDIDLEGRDSLIRVQLTFVATEENQHEGEGPRELGISDPNAVPSGLTPPSTPPSATPPLPSSGPPPRGAPPP